MRPGADRGVTDLLAYRALLAQLDAWMDEGHRRHPGVIPCRAGCSACCHGPFDISAADAELVRAAVAALPDADGAAIRGRAAAQVRRAAELAGGWEAPWDVAALGDAVFDQVAERLADEPCPCLDAAGRCLIYADRPLTCRLIGLPMLTAGGEILENHCPIQERWPAYAALPPLPFDLEAFHEAEARAIAAAEARLGCAAGFETTIAGAIAGA